MTQHRWTLRYILKHIRMIFLFGCLTISVSSMAQDHYVFITHGDLQDPMWKTVHDAARLASRQLQVKLSFFGEPDIKRMSAQIERAINQKVDGLVVSIPDSSSLYAVLQKATAQHIPIISINSGEKFSKNLGALIHIGQNEKYAAEKAGVALRALGATHGLCVNHAPEVVSFRQRCIGLNTGMSDRAEMLQTTTDPKGITELILLHLRSNPKIDAILALSILDVDPIIAALKEYRSGKHNIKLATFDISPQIVQYIRDGQVDFTIDQQPFLQGYLPIVLLKNYRATAAIPVFNIQTGPKIIHKRNVSQVIQHPTPRMR